MPHRLRRCGAALIGRAILERSDQEEVLADVAERPLHLALRLGPLGSAGLGLEALVARQRQQRAVEDDLALVDLPTADRRGLA